LGIEWINRYFDPIIDRYPISIENKLNTIVEHIAQQISAKTEGIKSLYTTGGGVYNSFLIERINANIKGEIIIPSNEIIEFKEAIIFGFLGALYLKNKPNSLKQVTGSQRDSCGGILHTPY
jgi:anhydro-N-acetylmuramic acid kinase